MIIIVTGDYFNLVPFSEFIFYIHEFELLCGFQNVFKPKFHNFQSFKFHNFHCFSLEYVHVEVVVFILRWNLLCVCRKRWC